MRVQAELHGVVPVQNGEFLAMQKSALRWFNRLKQAVAVCNSLNMVGRHTVVGVDMERTLFKAVEARFLVRPCSGTSCTKRALLISCRDLQQSP